MTLKICLIGDVLAGELPFTKNYGLLTQFEKHNGQPWYGEIKKIISQSDITIGNLECPLVEKENVVSNVFFGAPEFASFLKNCGINIVNVANNHILEQGEYGFNRTIEVLTKYGVDLVGNVDNSKPKVLFKESNGYKIGIAGFSNVDLHKINNNNKFAVLNETNVLWALEEMKKNGADVKVLTFHWGSEYIHLPSSEQRRLAYLFVDAGADIIAGHHPHVIQPYEQYNNGHIFYSLGNFIFDYMQSKRFSIGLHAIIEIKSMKSIQVHNKGIKLSYKNLVTPIDEQSFNKYFYNINEKYNKLKEVDTETYNTKYDRLLKRNRTVERILMKTSLINEFFRINKNAKANLLKNVFTYYLKK